MSGAGFTCRRKQIPAFFSHDSQSDEHGLSVRNHMFINNNIDNINHKSKKHIVIHLQDGGNGYHSEGIIQNARLAPIIS